MCDLGPRTGTFEPPHFNKYSRNSDIWNTLKEMHQDMEKKEKSLSNLIQLTQEIIGAYERNDKESLNFLLAEFEQFKK